MTPTFGHRSFRVVARRGERDTSAGFSASELLIVVAILGLMLAVSSVSLGRILRGHRLGTATAAVQDYVTVARVKSMREKIAHRVSFQDENDTPPNRMQIEVADGGGFSALADYVYFLPVGTSIQGSGPTTSVARIEINGRGECSGGSVYLGGSDGDAEVVTILASCLTRVP